MITLYRQSYPDYLNKHLLYSLKNKKIGCKKGKKRSKKHKYNHQWYKYMSLKIRIDLEIYFVIIYFCPKLMDRMIHHLLDNTSLL